MDTAEDRFRAAMAAAGRLYAISEEEPLQSPSSYCEATTQQFLPRPDLAVASLSSAAAADVERCWNLSPASLAAELADFRYVTVDQLTRHPVVVTFTACSGATLFCNFAYQAGLTTFPPLEIMNPEILPFFSLSLGARTVTHYLHLMSLFYQQRKTGSRGRFLFKLRYSDYLTVRSSGYWRYWASRATPVRLRRVNLERQAVSVYRAATADHGASSTSSRDEFRLDSNKLLSIYDDLVAQERLWDECYAIQPATAATFFHEEFKAGPSDAIHELFQFLGEQEAASLELEPGRRPEQDPFESVSGILANLIRSARDISITDLVQRIYRVVLERPADPEGLRAWTGVGESNPFEAILLPIFDSDERRQLKERKNAAAAAARSAAGESGGMLRDPYHGHAAVCDILALQNQVDDLRDTDFRIAMTASCQDCAAISKVKDAGRIIQEGHETVQVMHNGIRVVADGYYGKWMTEIIARLQGHHEPQEEAMFHQVLQLIRGPATMLELGGFWSYYSLWFLQGDRSERRAFVIEPDPNHLAIGRRNAELNSLPINFVQVAIGRVAQEVISFATETAGEQTIRQISVPDFLTQNRIDRLDILHCDAQGIEFDVLQSCETLFREQRIGFTFVSTHDRRISGDPLTHQRCLAFLRLVGARILAEHDVHESFSGDGLIVAYSGGEKMAWPNVHLSFNRYSCSLTRNPLIDLALAQQHLV
jgi:FkbM family methyltransferase